jgi:N-methylhydantoinase A
VALIDGEPATTTECVVGGHPVRLPMIDIHTVGAGGGSLARCDAGGALVVGPESAGADPGPACYGRGRQATVTDAQLVLGRLPEDLLLGGNMPLDAGRARAAVQGLADGLGCDVERAAAGVIEVANAGMTRAIRVVSLARGHDPRDFALFCFGGAGGLHATDLAASLGMGRVVVPPDSGTFSAYGMMTADVILDASRSVLLPLVEVDASRRDALAQPLAAQLLTEMQTEGFAAGQVKLVRSLDLRYQGQSFELTVPDGSGVEAAFHDLHQRRYDHRRPGAPLELVTLRIRAVGPVADPDDAVSCEPRPAPLAAARQLDVWFEGRRRTTDLYKRSDLRPGDRFTGPAIIADTGSTTAVPPDWEASVDSHLNLHLVPNPVEAA